MKLIGSVLFVGGLLLLALAFGFIFQVPFVIPIWPWPDGRLSYLFIGSILAAVSASAIWIGWAREFGALPGATVNIFVISVASAIYFLQRFFQGNHPDLFAYDLLALLAAIVSLLAFFWSRRIPLGISTPTPKLVRISFGIFLAALTLASLALLFHLPIFPWALNADSSVIFGCIFLGNAVYFLYGLIYPLWYHAKGQLLSFLAYDLVLIGPFLALFSTVKPKFELSLVVYIAVLIYSGAIALYYLFFNSQTRMGQRNP